MLNAPTSEVEQFFPEHLVLPVFPAVASQLLRSFSDDSLGLDAIGSLISQDAALAAKVLRLANSARYGSSRSVARLSDAAATLGLDNLRNLALAACLAESFPQAPGLDLRTFWRHGMACAHYAQLVSRSLDGDTEMAYVAGLMLRTGELIMLNVDAIGVVEVEAHAHEPGSRFDWEQQRWHCTHSDVTAELSRRWRFPEALTQAFVTCADPLEARPFSLLGATLRCAEIMADALMEGDEPVDALVRTQPALVAHLHLDLPWLTEKVIVMADPRREAEVLF